MTAPHEYYTLPEFAKKLRISEDAARRVIERRTITVLNVSQGTKRKRYRIPVSEIDKLAIPAELKPKHPASSLLPGQRRIV